MTEAGSALIPAALKTQTRLELGLLSYLIREMVRVQM